MPAATPKTTYSKIHVTPWRNGWRYKRAIPRDVLPVLGADVAAWTKYLGPISKPDAIAEARRINVDHDDTIRRVRRMTQAERDDVIKSGGLLLMDAEATSLGRSLQRHEEASTGRNENDVDLAAPDALHQIKTIRDSRKAGVALRASIERRRTTVAKFTGGKLAWKLAALVPVWERVAVPRRKKSISKKHLYLGRFVTVVGDLEPRAVKREHAVKFRDAMQAKGESRTNVTHMLEELHRLFSVALSENLIESNPFAGVKVARDAGAKFADDQSRKPFTGSQVLAIIAAADALATKGADDLRWIIRLLVYHGARSGEICQLRSCDVTTVVGVPVLRITDEVGSLKNKFSRRDIPIHPECMGIVAFAAARAHQSRLFAEFSKAKDCGAIFQSWAAKFLDKTVGIVDTDLTMHSLRHTWRTVAREIDMPEAVSRSIMGHSLGKDDHAAYGSAPSLAKRADWMKKVDPTQA